MKSKIISGTVATLALLTGMTAALAASGGGDGKVGNGGDGCAAEFAAIGLNLARMLPDLGVRDVNQDEFQKTVEKTPVVVTEKDLFVQGKKVQAINDPDKKLITINKSLCDPLATPPASKVMVVFHEYLGIMRLEKSGEYRISSSISNLLTDGTLELLTSGTKKPRNFRVDGICLPAENVIRSENIPLDNDKNSAKFLLSSFKHGAYIRNIAHNDLDADYIFVQGSLDTCKMAVEIIRKKFRKQVVEKLMRDFASGDSNASFRAQSTLQVVGGNLDKRWISYSPNTTYFLWATNIWLVSHAAEWGNPGLMKLIVDANWHEPRTDWSKPADINNGQYDNSLYSAVRRAAWEFQKFGASKKYLQYLQVMQILLRAGHVPNDPAIVSSISDYKQENFCGQSDFWDMLTSPGNPYPAQKMAAYGSSCGVCGGNADALKTHFASMITRMPARVRLDALSLMAQAAKTVAEKTCIKGLGWKENKKDAYIAMFNSIRFPDDKNKYTEFSQAVQKAYDGGNWNDAIDWNSIIDPNGGDGATDRLPTPLMYAVWKGDIFLVRLMLSQKTGDLHGKYSFCASNGSSCYEDFSLLEMAILEGKTEIAKMLVGAGMGLKDISGIYPFILYGDHTGAFKFLMELGVDPNNFTNARIDNISPLHYAIYIGKEEKALILLDHGANPRVAADKGSDGLELPPHGGMPPIHLAVYKKMYRLVEKLVQKGERVDRLVDIPDENGPDSCIQRKGFYTPLMYAAQAGDLEMTRLLIRLGANANARYSGEVCYYHDQYSYKKKYSPYSLSAADLAERNGHFWVGKFLRKHMSRKP